MQGATPVPSFDAVRAAARRWLFRIGQPVGRQGQQGEQLTVRLWQAHPQRFAVDDLYGAERIAGVADAKRREEDCQGAGGCRGERARPGGERILRLNGGAGLVLRGAQMEGVRSARVADLPVIGKRRDRTLVLVESGQALEDFAADRERRRVIDQGRIERLCVFGLDQLQVARSAGRAWRTRRCRRRGGAGAREQHQRQPERAGGANDHFLDTSKVRPRRLTLLMGALLVASLGSVGRAMAAGPATLVSGTVVPHDPPMNGIVRLELHGRNDTTSAWTAADPVHLIWKHDGKTAAEDTRQLGQPVAVGASIPLTLVTLAPTAVCGINLQMVLQERRTTRPNGD